MRKATARSMARSIRLDLEHAGSRHGVREEHEVAPPLPAPSTSMDEMFAEMAANDDEFRAWREGEARVRLA